MSHVYSSHKVIIEPYCIFCREPTDHVETRTFADYSSSTYKAGDKTYLSSSSSSFTSPFPTHPKCLEHFQRGRRTGRLLGLAPAAAVVGFVLLLVVRDLIRYGAVQQSAILSPNWLVPLFLGALGLGGVLWYRINKQVTSKLRSKITLYYETHVQADSPPLAEGEEPRTLVVNSSGSGDYQKIETAILYAQPGARILVQPGTYYGPITINKPVEIVGDGPVEDIIIRRHQLHDSCCFRMQTYDATLRGLTLTDPGEGYFAVSVAVGRLILEDCDISSSFLACVGIYGPMAEAVIRRCKIHSGHQDGIFIRDKGQATVEDCDIFRLRHSGVAVEEGGNVAIRRCQMHEMERFGIGFWDSKGTVEDCDIFDNHSSGVLINDGARAVIQRCRINRNAGVAVLVLRGVATVIDCDLTDNSKGAWQIEEGCEVNQTGNRE